MRSGRPCCDASGAVTTRRDGRRQLAGSGGRNGLSASQPSPLNGCRAAASVTVAEPCLILTFLPRGGLLHRLSPASRSPPRAPA